MGNENSKLDILKGANRLLISVLVGIVLCFVFLSIFSFALVAIATVSTIVAGIFSTMSASIGAFASGFVLARRNGHKGMFYGALASCFLFFVLLLLNISLQGLPFTSTMFIKFLCMILSGVFGGITGVNKRRR